MNAKDHYTKSLARQYLLSSRLERKRMLAIIKQYVDKETYEELKNNLEQIGKKLSFIHIK